MPDAAPVELPIFNQPLTDSERESIGKEELSEVRSALVGLGTHHLDIRATFFHITEQRLAAALYFDATRPNVSVHVLLDGSNRTLGCHGRLGCVNPAYQQLERLNNLESTHHSWVRTCDGAGRAHPSPVPGDGNGCIGPDRDHNKFMLLSRTEFEGTEPVADVVFQTSSNSTGGSENRAFNDAGTIARYRAYKGPGLGLLIVFPLTLLGVINHLVVFRRSWTVRVMPEHSLPGRRFSRRMGSRGDATELAAALSDRISAGSWVPGRPL